MSTESVPGARPKINPWIVGIAVMSSSVMEVLDTSVVNVSLPHIAGSLSSTVDEATWVLTSYIVANAIILPITGWLANYFGRKRRLLAAHINPYNTISRQTLERFRDFFHQGGADWTTAGQKAQNLLYGMLQQQSSLLSFLETFRVLGFLFLGLLPLIFLMHKTLHGKKKAFSAH